VILTTTVCYRTRRVKVRGLARSFFRSRRT